MANGEQGISIFEVSLKELRESMVWLKIIKKRSMIPAEQSVSVLPECNELISIFVKSIQTAQKSL
jgi:four helix bundle protein